MLKIGEFSKLMQISIRMLRYYDEVDLLKPAEVNELTGYRFYSNAEVERLNKILYLRDLGFSIDEMKEMMTSWNEPLVKKRFEEKEKEIVAKLVEEERKLSKLRQVQRDFNSSMESLCEKIVIKEIPSYWVLSLRRIVPNYYDEGELWQILCGLIQKEKIELSNDSKSFAIYHDGEYKEQNVEIEVCVVIDQPIPSRGELICHQVEGYKNMASLMVYGPYKNIAPSYQAFIRWLEQHDKYHIIGCDRQISHRGPWNEVDENQYLVELLIPVEVIDGQEAATHYSMD